MDKDEAPCTGSLPSAFLVCVLAHWNLMSILLLGACLSLGPLPISPVSQRLTSFSSSLWNLLRSTTYPPRYLPIACSQNFLLTYSPSRKPTNYSLPNPNDSLVIMFHLPFQISLHSCGWSYSGGVLKAETDSPIMPFFFIISLVIIFFFFTIRLFYWI